MMDNSRLNSRIRGQSMPDGEEPGNAGFWLWGNRAESFWVRLGSTGLGWPRWRGNVTSSTKSGKLQQGQPPRRRGTAVRVRARAAGVECAQQDN